MVDRPARASTTRPLPRPILRAAAGHQPTIQNTGRLPNRNSPRRTEHGVPGHVALGSAARDRPQSQAYVRIAATSSAR